jgi:hypothetical protein
MALYDARLLPMCLICSSAITTLLACELQKANQQPIKENFILAPLKTKITIATLLRGDETLKDAPASNKSVNWHNNYFFSIFYAKPSIFPLISHCK